MPRAVEAFSGNLYANVEQCDSSGRAGGLAVWIVKWWWRERKN